MVVSFHSGQEGDQPKLHGNRWATLSNYIPTKCTYIAVTLKLVLRDLQMVQVFLYTNDLPVGLE